MTNQTIAVALSGGIDSAVAAALLTEGGAQDGSTVCGLHLLLHAEADPAAGSSAMDRARQAAARLGIPLHVIDLRAEFRALVLAPFAAAYRAGRTPNPCLACNRAIKFGLLLERARGLCGAEHLATGHYARLSEDEDGQPSLLRGADPAKEQSYFLALVPRQVLKQVRFPLGSLSKAHVRRLAEGYRFWDGLPAESQEVCFLGEADYRGLVAAADSPGDIVDLAGKVLGRHRGVARYTVGQRRGLGLPGPEALYVRAIEPEANRVVVAAQGQAPFTWMLVGGLNWLSHPAEVLRCTVRTRYRQADQPCLATLTEGGRLRVEFEGPQQAISAGQGAVFYQGERVLAGGIIEQAG